MSSKRPRTDHGPNVELSTPDYPGLLSPDEWEQLLYVVLARLMQIALTVRRKQTKVLKGWLPRKIKHSPLDIETAPRPGVP
jgi:hypothetical protein